MKPSVRNSIETKAPRPTNFFLTSKSSIGNKFRKYCKHVSKFRKKPGGLSKFMPNPQKVLPWIGLRVVFLLFFIAETSDKMQLCKLHYFCYCLSLQVGVNMLAAIHFTVAFIVLLALSFTPRPSNTKEDNPLAYLLVYVYLTIAIIAYSIAVVASFLEYKVMYRTSYFLILISFIYWIALCGCAFFGDDRLKSLVCIDDRCGQSMWLISFKRATYIHGDCRAYVPHRVTRIRRRVRKGDEHQSDHNVTDFEWFTVNRNMTGIDDFSTRNHAGDLDWFGMSEELDYLPEKTTGAAADLFTTRFSNPISGLNSDILSSAMMSTAAQSSGALSSILIPNFRSSDESSEDPMIDPPSSSIDVESSELLPPGRIYSSGNDTRKPTFGKFNVLRESSTVGESVSSSNIASFKLPLPNGSFLKIGPFHDEFASIEPLYLYNVSDIPPQNIDPKTVTLFVSHLTSPEFEVSTVREEVEKERAANDGAENEDEIDFSKRKLSLVDTEKSEMLSPHIDEKANVDLKSTGLRHLSKMTNKRNIGVDTLFDTNIVVQRNSSETITDHKAAGDGKKDYRTMEEDRNSHKSGKRLIQNRESNSELLNGENERYSVRVKTLSAKLDDGEILKQIRDQYAGGESNSTTKKGPVVEQGARRRQGQNQGPGGAGRMQGGAGGRGRHNPRRKGGKPTTDANSSGDEEDDGGADDYESSYYDDGNGFPDKNLNGKANPAAVQPPGQGPSKSSQSAGQQKGVGVPIQSNFNPYDYFPPNLPEKKANAFPPGFLPPNLVRKPSAGGESSGVQEGAGTIGTRIKNATSSLWPFGPGGPGDATRNPPGQSPNATMEGGHCIFYSKATLFYVVSSLVLFFSNVGLVLYMLLVIRSHMDEVDKTGWSNGPYGFGTSTPVTGRSSAIYNVNGGAGSPSRSRATYSPVAQAPPSRPSSTPTPIPSEPVSTQPKSKSPSRAHAGYERDTNDDRGALDRRNPRSGGYRDTKDTDHRSPSRVTDTSNRYGSTPRDRETGSYRSPVRSADTNRRYGATVQDTDGYRSPTRRQLSPVRHDPTTNPVSRKVSFNVNDGIDDYSSSDDQYARRR